jgi:hypothetical protein
VIITNYRAVNALTTNSGQICFAATRVYVQAGIYDRFVEAYIAGFKNKMKVIGNPDDANSEIGPVVDKSQYDRIMNIIDTAQNDREGTLLVGGSSLDPEKVSNISYWRGANIIFNSSDLILRNIHRAIIFNRHSFATPNPTLPYTKKRYSVQLQ